MKNINPFEPTISSMHFHAVRKRQSLSYLLSILLLLVGFIFPCLGQNQITGLVLDKESGKTIDFANVFVANTSLGTYTDSEGLFLLKELPTEELTLIISYVGYETYTKILTVKEAQKVELRIELVPGTLLDEIMVKAKSGRKRRKYMKQFLHTFLGSSANAKSCRILNPEVLLFESLPNGGFRTFATDLLQIENKALGYKINFYLQHFKKNGTHVNYDGKPYFETLTAHSEAEQETWLANRELTFLGSKRHFFKSLYADNLEADGYVLEFMKQNGDDSFVHIASATKAEIAHSIPDKEEQILTFPNFLQICYVNEIDQIKKNWRTETTASTFGSQDKGLNMLKQKNKSSTKESKPYQTSLLLLNTAGVRFNKNGFLSRTRALIEYGYWTREGISDLLPNEYGRGTVNGKR